MLTRPLALALRQAGVRWDPAPGDAFWVPDRDLDEHVFVLSDMVVQTLRPPQGPPVLAFNGTTEWALDSLDAHEAVWLPREDQLRTLLGGTFLSLERAESDLTEDLGDDASRDRPERPDDQLTGWTVTTRSGADAAGRPRVERHSDQTPEGAYARALLALLDAPVD